jgi:hypothetical protein
MYQHFWDIGARCNEIPTQRFTFKRQEVSDVPTNLGTLEQCATKPGLEDSPMIVQAFPSFRRLAPFKRGSCLQAVMNQSSCKRTLLSRAPVINIDTLQVSEISPRSHDSGLDLPLKPSII